MNVPCLYDCAKKDNSHQNPFFLFVLKGSFTLKKIVFWT
jgi:hypothetical protein